MMINRSERLPEKPYSPMVTYRTSMCNGENISYWNIKCLRKEKKVVQISEYAITKIVKPKDAIDDRRIVYRQTLRTYKVGDVVEILTEDSIAKGRIISFVHDERNKESPLCINVRWRVNGRFTYTNRDPISVFCIDSDPLPRLRRSRNCS